MKQQPNILLIHSDQHRYDCAGANGHPLVQTPQLDRLAREGANFSHAFTPAPICAPARASLLTGTWPTTHRCTNIPQTESFQPAREELPTLWRLLSNTGYRQALVGKFHQEVTGTPEDHGVDDYIPRSGYSAWRQSQNLPPPPDSHGWFGDADPYVDPAHTRAAWLADHALGLVRRYHGEKRPFFIRYDPDEPHLPCRPPAKLAEVYPAELVTPWPSFPDPLTDKPYVQKRQLKIWGTQDWTWSQWQPVVARYLAEITLIDQQVGRLLALLTELGIAEDTLVIYTTDHGDFCGGHGFMDKHFSMYDDILRVPLMMRFPGVIFPGCVCDAFVTHEIDLARTILEVAGAEVPPTFEGMNLIRVLNGQDEQRRDIFAQYQGCQMGLYSCRMIRNREWKYVWNPTSAVDELYQVADDPGEIRNRISDPLALPALSALRRRLIEWMEAAHDPLLNSFTRSLLDPAQPAPPRLGP